MKPYEIRSNAVAKRAFEVAAVGDLGIMLVGPLGTSKTTLREAFPAVRSAERETCACGHYLDITRNCTCPVRMLARWVRRIERDARSYDIVLEACATPAREMISRNMNTPHDDEMRTSRIAAARKYGETHQSLELADDAAARTVEMAVRRMSLTNGQYRNMLKVARAIANLDASETLKAKHVAEAIQYNAASMLRSVCQAA